jgi:hypothetical protein
LRGILHRGAKASVLATFRSRDPEQGLDMPPAQRLSLVHAIRGLEQLRHVVQEDGDLGVVRPGRVLSDGQRVETPIRPPGAETKLAFVAEWQS